MTSQNGLKYRFICEDCNNKLGTRYDIELNKFTLSLSMFLKSTLQFPLVIKFKVKPVKLIKAVLGHILSCKENIDESVFDKKVRDYLFDDNAKLNNDIKIFYWIYPYNESRIVRDFLLLRWRNGEKVRAFCQVLKYFPIAFLVTNQSKFDDLNELTIFKNFPIDKEIEIPIKLHDKKENDYPERVDDNTVLFMTKETGNSVLTKPKR